MSMKSVLGKNTALHTTRHCVRAIMRNMDKTTSVSVSEGILLCHYNNSFRCAWKVTSDVERLLKFY